MIKSSIKTCINKEGKIMFENIIEEISIEEMSGFKIGHAENKEAMTGVTAIIFDEQARCGVDISGGGPASRETPLLDPKMACENINCLVLSGGSAFGLEAGVGACRYLEEQGIGFETGYAKVPLVCQSCIYDLSIGSSKIRPDVKMGYEACKNAFESIFVNSEMGNVGAGIGATVGKLKNMSNSMNSGLGICAFKLGELKVAAIVVVNALGDIFDYDTGEKIAGMLTDDRTAYDDCEENMYKLQINMEQGYSNNTTIGAIITNGDFSKADMNKVARMATNAYSKCIKPVATTADGDTIYAVSTGNVKADINAVGTLAARAMGEAIKNAINKSKMPDEEYLKIVL